MPVSALEEEHRLHCQLHSARVGVQVVVCCNHQLENFSIMDLSLFSLLPLIMIFAFPAGEAIMCFECNSGDIYEHEKCANVDRAGTEYLTNCSNLEPRDGFPYVRCRVVVQDVEGQVRIVRSCATWPDKEKVNRCVDRTGTQKIKVRYCECDTDNCNGSSRVYGSLSLLLATILSLLVGNSMFR